jgi:hypothetical protein
MRPVVLTPADQQRIDTLAAHFIEDSELLLSLSHALSEAVIRHIEADMRKCRPDYTPE